MNTEFFFKLDLDKMDEDELDDWVAKHRKSLMNHLKLVQEDFTFDNHSKLENHYYQRAMFLTRREVYQAVEAMYHNLNTLQSRSGNQLPFTSINYGTCTLPEGRLVTRALLDQCIKGVGKIHRTSVFPCGIFQTSKKWNLYPGTPNYDLFRLALKSTAKRLYPNYANIDWSGNIGYDENDPKTYFSTINKPVVCSSNVV